MKTEITETEYPNLPAGVLWVKVPAMSMFPERDFLLWPHFAGLGYQVRDSRTNKVLGHIATQNVKDNLENGTYILLDNSKSDPEKSMLNN